MNSRKLFIGVGGVVLFALVAVLAALAGNNMRRPAPELPPGGTLVATLSMWPSAHDVVAGFGSIWISSGPGGTVTRIDPTTDAVTAVITLPDPAAILAVGEDSIWVTSAPGNRVTRIDPATDRVVGSLTSGERGALGITVSTVTSGSQTIMAIRPVPWRRSTQPRCRSSTSSPSAMNQMPGRPR